MNIRVLVLGVLLCTTMAPLEAIAQEKENTSRAVSNNNQDPALLVVHDGDLEKSCSALIKEGKAMTEIIALSDKQIGNSKIQEKGIGVAGAIGSFLVGSVTGGLGFAAAGFIAKEIPQNNAEYAMEVRDVAGQRRSLMMGIYKAKDCSEPWPDDLIQMDDAIEKSPEERIKKATEYSHRHNQSYND